MIVSIVTAAVAFGIFTFAGLLIARTYFGGEPIADGPPAGEPPVNALLIAAVIAGGIGILATGALWLDPALSIAIAAMIVWSSVTIVRETLNILLEGTPRALQLADIRDALAEVPGVLDVHDLHVWSLGSASHALASHVTIPEMPLSECSSILDAINCALRDRFHITHTTIQFEIRGCETTHGCSAPPALEAVSAHAHQHDHSH